MDTIDNKHKGCIMITSSNPSPLFVVILRYLVDAEIVDTYRQAHVAFLQKHYNDGVFIVSGVQTPRTGGVIIAKSESRQALEVILQQDPFALHKLAEYQIYAFTPARYSKAFEAVMREGV